MHALKIFSLLLGFCFLSPFHSGAQETLSDSAIQKVVDQLAGVLEAYYVEEETGRAMSAALSAKWEKGSYDALSDPASLAEQLTEDLQSVYPDRHLKVYVGKSSLDVYSERPDEAYYIAKDRKLNFGFREVKILPGNVGYLAFDEFSTWAEAEEVVTASLGFVSRADALIIDLRDNDGGAPEMVQYIGSHFLDKNQKEGFSSLYFRYQDKTLTFPNLRQVKGPRLAEVPLFILTSAYTGSAAESFSYDLQQLKRATLIGDTTSGGANPAKVFTLAHGFRALVAIGKAINPITGENWEGRGVFPDVVVSEDHALDSAYFRALQVVAERNPEGDFHDYVEELLEKKRLEAFQYSLDPAALSRLAGTYGERKILFRDGVLWYVNTAKSDREYRLVGLPDGLFTFDAQNTPLEKRSKLRFAEEEGKITGYHLIYPSGRSTFIERNKDD